MLAAAVVVVVPVVPLAGQVVVAQAPSMVLLQPQEPRTPAAAAGQAEKEIQAALAAPAS